MNFIREWATIKYIPSTAQGFPSTVLANEQGRVSFPHKRRTMCSLDKKKLHLYNAEGFYTGDMYCFDFS